MRGKRPLALLLIIAVAATGVAAAATMQTGPSAINEQADAGHNPYVDIPVTVAEHDVGWEATWYEDNNGDRAELPAKVNESAVNPERYVTSDVNFSQALEYPRKSAETGNNDASIGDASEWTTDSSNTAGSGSVSEVTTAPGVDALQVSATGTSGDRFIATYGNQSITSDVPKRSLQLVADVDTLGSGTNVTVTVNDTDGDFVRAVINTNEDASTGSTIANSTGEGYVLQQQIGEMDVQGNGDGSMGEIADISVIVADGDATVNFAAINAQKLGMWDFGDRKADWDDDDNNETQAVMQVNESGTLEVTDVDTMGPAFDSATIHGLTIPAHFYSSDQAEVDDYEKWNVTYSDAEQFPSYDERVDDYRRIAIPSAYDLSYGSGELKTSQPVPDSAYQTVQYTASAGTTNFSQISWTDATSSYSSIDQTVTLASGIGGGDKVAWNADYVVTSEQADALMSTSTGGGAPMSGSGGGFFSTLFGKVAGLGTSLMIALGLKKRRSGGS